MGAIGNYNIYWASQIELQNRLLNRAIKNQPCYCGPGDTDGPYQVYHAVVELDSLFWNSLLSSWSLFLIWIYCFWFYRCAQIIRHDFELPWEHIHCSFVKFWRSLQAVWFTIWFIFLNSYYILLSCYPKDYELILGSLIYWILFIIYYLCILCLQICYAAARINLIVLLFVHVTIKQPWLLTHLTFIIDQWRRLYVPHQHAQEQTLLLVVS